MALHFRLMILSHDETEVEDRGGSELRQHPLLLATIENIQDNLRYWVFGVEVGDKWS